jgi:hypothetical protein
MFMYAICVPYVYVHSHQNDPLHKRTHKHTSMYVHTYHNTVLNSYSYIQTSSDIPASVSYQANSLSKPAVATYEIAPLDAQETTLEPGQEIASPVLTMVHSPGSRFEKSIKVTLPVNNRISEWYAAEQQAQTLSALGVRSTAPTRSSNQDRQDSDTFEKMASRSTLQEGQLQYDALEQEIVNMNAQDVAHGRYADKQIGIGEPNSWSNNARRDGASGATHTDLRLHWFNSRTLNWMPARRGNLVDGKLMSELPPDVLNDPAFSGKVANLLASSTDAPILPLCGEFEDLVAGRVPFNVLACTCVLLAGTVYVHVCSMCLHVHVCVKEQVRMCRPV